MLTIVKSVRSPVLNVTHISILDQVQAAVDTRHVDKEMLLTVAGGRLACSLLHRLCEHLRNRTILPLNLRIRSFYSAHIFHSYLRLDVPTFDDPIVQGRLESASQFQSNVAWDTMQAMTQAFSIVLRMIAELSVLASVLRDQKDTVLLAALCFIPPTLQWFRRQKFWNVGGTCSLRSSRS